MSSDPMPRPGEDKVNQIPSLPGSKRRQMPGVCPGGGCLSFDYYYYNSGSISQHLTVFLYGADAY